jgi:ankyrin repeat protein
MIDAVKAGDIDRVEALLAADPALARAQDDAGNSAILLATYYGRKAMVERLRAHDLELNIFEAAAIGDAERVAALAEDDPGRVNAFSHDGYTPLGLAAFFGHETIAKDLLERGADVNAASRNRMRVMPLHSAVAGGHIGIARALVERGADVNASQQDGFKPLHGAAQNGQDEMVLLLINHGADIDAQTGDGRTALSIAQAEGHEVVVDLLRRQGASD